MKLFRLLPFLLLSSCAFRAYYPNGHVAFADYTNFNGTTELHNDKFWIKRSGVQDASGPTKVFTDAVVKGLMTGTVGGAAMATGL